MVRVWSPSAPGKLLTNTPAWSVELHGESFRFGMNGHHKGSSVNELKSFQVKRFELEHEGGVMPTDFALAVTFGRGAPRERRRAKKAKTSTRWDCTESHVLTI